MSTNMVVRVEGQEFILERVFDAPRELVFKAMSEAEHLKHWWGPRGWELTVCNVDFRPGGVWHYCMKCIDENQGDFFGFEAWGKALYQEIEVAEKIVYDDYFSDAEGHVAEGMPASHITITFLEHEGRTKLISCARYESVEALQHVIQMGMEQGIRETWDRLDEHLQAVK
ncbi:SRPBCC domain-containing protein [Paenibacillus aestuarii]|uniref:SRPBCC domain-containing protein n=1 Tax=Paenibacillus aestuarii TaxID=516965 RepID=A0ABW0K2W4_9BACL|nr:SRPBCC domain-containing protein [Paenibacillus aestuarii]